MYQTVKQMSQDKYVSITEAARYAREKKLSSIKEWLEASEGDEFQSLCLSAYLMYMAVNGQKF